MVVRGAKFASTSKVDLMRLLPIVAAALGLAACAPQVPESGSGVGFGDYNSYVRSAQPVPNAPLNPMAGQTAAAPMTGFSPANAAAAIDRATGAVPASSPMTSTAPMAMAPASMTPMPMAPAPMASTLAAAPMETVALDANGQRPRGNAPAGIQEESGEMAALHASISDENDFEAVKSRETIQSDKARIERNKSQYTIDQPGALPTRNGGTEVSAAIQFALSTTHPVGTPMYKRSSLKFKSPDAACRKYGSDIEAQEEFLAAGGPERDRRGTDPDGDGFACGFDPAPFRAAKL